MEVLAISTKELQINDEIRAKEVRIIGDNGEQLGVLQTSAALAMAYEKDLDLVLIAPNAEPPVCSWGFWLWKTHRKWRMTRDWILC